MGKAKYKQKGITLIALVITIVVLLILAGISINLIMGDNGIIAKANYAGEKTRLAGIQEEIELWNSAKLVNSVSGITKTESANELIDRLQKEKYLSSEEANKLKDGETIKIAGVDVKINISDEDIENGNNIPDTLKIGDYVNYNPSGTPYSNCYNVAAQYSGETADQIAYQQSTKWRILSVDNNKIELVPENVLYIGNAAGNTVKLSLKGGEGYNNGVDLLNILCEKLYSNASKGAEARCINQLDIDKYSTYEKGSEAGSSYNPYKYGDLFEANSVNMPNLYINEKGYNDSATGIGQNELVGLGTYKGLSNQTATIKITAYSYKLSDYCNDSKIIELLEKNNRYWIATRNVFIDNDTGTPGKGFWPYFSIGNYSSLFDNKYGPYSYSSTIFPIVTIDNPNLELDEENSTSEINYWNI